MNPKIVKFIVKGTLGSIVSILIGTSIKMEKRARDRIDKHFENKDVQDN